MSRLSTKQNSNQLKDYLKLMNEIPLLSREEEEVYLQQMFLGNAKAKSALVENYLPQVVGWVNPLRGGGENFQKLIETGNRAMIKALDSYEKNSSLPLFAVLHQAVKVALQSMLKAKS